MEELRETAKSHFRAGTPQVQALAEDFFMSMDSDGDGRVDLEEFLSFMRQHGYSQMRNRDFFKILDRERNGLLGFWEVMTLYYIVKSGRPFCDCCAEFIPGIFFSCVVCYNRTSQSSFSICPRCYRHNKCKHNHNGERALFLDNYTLLQAQRVSASSSRHRSTSRSRHLSASRSKSRSASPSKSRSALRSKSRSASPSKSRSASRSKSRSAARSKSAADHHLVTRKAERGSASSSRQSAADHHHVTRKEERCSASRSRQSAADHDHVTQKAGRGSASRRYADNDFIQKEFEAKLARISQSRTTTSSTAIVARNTATASSPKTFHVNPSTRSTNYSNAIVPASTNMGTASILFKALEDMIPLANLIIQAAGAAAGACTIM